jgi:hypothetical protein
VAWFAERAAKWVAENGYDKVSSSWKRVLELNPLLDKARRSLATARMQLEDKPAIADAECGSRIKPVQRISPSGRTWRRTACERGMWAARLEAVGRRLPMGHWGMR